MLNTGVEEVIRYPTLARMPPSVRHSLKIQKASERKCARAIPDARAGGEPRETHAWHGHRVTRVQHILHAPARPIHSSLASSSLPTTIPSTADDGCPVSVLGHHLSPMDNQARAMVHPLRKSLPCRTPPLGTGLSYILGRSPLCLDSRHSTGVSPV